MLLWPCSPEPFYFLKPTHSLVRIKLSCNPSYERLIWCFSYDENAYVSVGGFEPPISTFQGSRGRPDSPTRCYWWRTGWDSNPRCLNRRLKVSAVRHYGNQSILLYWQTLISQRDVHLFQTPIVSTGEYHTGTSRFKSLASTSIMTPRAAISDILVKKQPKLFQRNS